MNTDTDTPVISCRDVMFRREGRTIVGPITLDIFTQQHWVILGPNGAGKSSLLSLFGAQTYSNGGELRILGSRPGQIPLRDIALRIGMISSFSQRWVSGSVTVYETLQKALAQGDDKAIPDHDRIAQILALTDTENVAQQSLFSLSAGEKQRVFIGCALITDPEILLLDEPAGALDFGQRERWLMVLESILTSPRSPVVILVTHHVEEIPAGFTHGMLLRDGQAWVQGPLTSVLTQKNLSEVYGFPITLFTKECRYFAVAQRE